MTPSVETATHVTLSGRDLALQRRQALARHGRGGSAVRTASTATSPRVPAPPVAAAEGKADCGCGGRDPGCAASTPRAAHGLAGSAPMAGRALAQARRQALAQAGKAALAGRSSGAATTAPASAPVRPDAAPAAVVAGMPHPAAAAGRQLAMQRRRALALGGRSVVASGASRPSGRPRPQPAAAIAAAPASRTTPAVATVTAASVRAGLLPTRASGAPAARLTGLRLGEAGKVTGGEAGADRAVTGTRYADPGQDRAPDKVARSHTAAGQTVTGSVLGRSERVTGDEPGACRAVTGAQYLAAEQFAQCGSAPPATPRKVSVMSARGGGRITGIALGPDAEVTGGEAGACRAITGSQYLDPIEAGACPVRAAPAKVATLATHGGQRVTGGEPGGGARVTGTLARTQRAPSGIDLGGPAATAPAAKVAVDATLRGPVVTGQMPGRAPQVTGDVRGSCATVTGTPYAGRRQYEAFCPAPALEAQAARVPVRTTITASVVSGDRPGAGGNAVTGDDRGACVTVSGTPYIGRDNGAAACPPDRGFQPRALREAPAEPVPAPPPRDFSIASPARRAGEARQAQVTGNSFAVDRITGPVNKAAELITGTPEFRHRAPVTATAPVAPPAARRLTGAGREDARITGDAWHALRPVTGTEGTSALARNATLRGQPRGAGSDARRFREVERLPVPDSPITGSAGNTRRGATVTLSGGARG
ncbi:CsoS2 family carboxysome shell protein [Thermomonas flagellata]|uniref:CsoS2 family carboxysome shell protein n=1 Tax=Thermomonas flagellata TaxID=2888524 RepID=UPI001F038CAE|nr:CsoS2 family carboxysome shell protein [Thermomonas flagellata]